MADTGKMKIAPAPRVNGGITALVGVFFRGIAEKQRISLLKSFLPRNPSGASFY